MSISSSDCCNCTIPDYGQKGCPEDSNCEEFLCYYDDCCCLNMWHSDCAATAESICATSYDYSLYLCHQDSLYDIFRMKYPDCLMLNQLQQI